MRVLLEDVSAQGKQWVFSFETWAADWAHMKFPWPIVLLNEYEVNAPPTCTLIGRVYKNILCLDGFIRYIS